MLTLFIAVDLNNRLTEMSSADGDGRHGIQDPVVVEVNDLVDIVTCVALFYEKGKSGSSFLRKEKFRAELPRSLKSLKAVKERVR